MNREEFIKANQKMSPEEMIRQVCLMRERSASRIPPQVQPILRSLDDRTDSKEMYVDTAFGKTHVFVIRKKEKGGESLLPVMINIHGGGWSLPHGERDIYFSRRIANRMNCLVLDVDYVLAPEHPYPQALDEIDALLDILPALLPSLGGDPENVVLCGQSAGGNLAAGVMERRAAGGTIRTPGLNIRAQILCYLPTDNYSDRFCGEELNARAMDTEYYGFFYNRTMEERKKFDVSPLFSDDRELKGLPPTEIMTAGKDELCREGKAYSDLLRKNGVPGSYRCFENSRHGFLINLYDEWKEGEEEVCRLLKEYFA